MVIITKRKGVKKKMEPLTLERGTQPSGRNHLGYYEIESELS